MKKKLHSKQSLHCFIKNLIRARSKNQWSNKRIEKIIKENSIKMKLFFKFFKFYHVFGIKPFVEALSFPLVRNWFQIKYFRHDCVLKTQFSVKKLAVKINVHSDCHFIYMYYKVYNRFFHNNSIAFCYCTQNATPKIK